MRSVFKVAIFAVGSLMFLSPKVVCGQTPVGPPAGFTVGAYMGQGRLTTQDFNKGNCHWRQSFSIPNFVISSALTKENQISAASLSFEYDGTPIATISSCPGHTASNVVYAYSLNTGQVYPDTGNITVNLECAAHPDPAARQVVFNGKVTNGRLVGTIQVRYTLPDGSSGAMTIPVS